MEEGLEVSQRHCWREGGDACLGVNLAVMRRAVVSVALHWTKRCPNPRKATLSGFDDAMRSRQSKKTSSLVTARHSSVLRRP